MPNEKLISYTNEQIKQAAETYTKSFDQGNINCDECVLCDTVCNIKIAARLLTLESEAADLRAKLAESEKREKAAVSDLKLSCDSGDMVSPCAFCVHLAESNDDEPCLSCEKRDQWKWRGVQAENAQPMDNPTATLRENK